MPYKMLTTPGRRFIHTPKFHAQTPRLVVVGNNAMLFATLDALNHHGADLYPNIDYVYPKFWLDDLHPEYFGLDWGQTMYGLPRTVRIRLQAKYPNYPENAYLRWGDFRDLRMRTLEELSKHKNVTLHMNEPVNIEPTAHGWNLSLATGKELSVPPKSFFYWWYRKPRIGHGMSNSHTLLYTMSRTLVPNPMIIVGQGLSLVWLLKHFPEHTFINIKRPGAKIPHIPVNKDVDIEYEIKRGRLQVFTSDKYETVTDPTGVLGNIVEVATGEMMFKSGMPIFAAAGVIPDHNICKKIPRNQIVLMPDINTHGELLGPDDAKVRFLLRDRFVAPADLLTGSLSQSYTFFMDLTDNMDWTSEPMFFYTKSRAERIKNHVDAWGISLTVRYFDAIDDKIGSLDNPLNFEQALNLYIEIFKTMYSPSDIDTMKFKKCLQEFFKLDAQSELTKKSANMKPGGL